MFYLDICNLFVLLAGGLAMLRMRYHFLDYHISADLLSLVRTGLGLYQHDTCRFCIPATAGMTVLTLLQSQFCIHCCWTLTVSDV